LPLVLVFGSQLVANHISNAVTNEILIIIFVLKKLNSSSRFWNSHIFIKRDFAHDIF
jgi:hypothetical protein